MIPRTSAEARAASACVLSSCDCATAFLATSSVCRASSRLASASEALAAARDASTCASVALYASGSIRNRTSPSATSPPSVKPRSSMKPLTRALRSTFCAATARPTKLADWVSCISSAAATTTAGTGAPAGMVCANPAPAPRTTAPANPTHLASRKHLPRETPEETSSIICNPCSRWRDTRQLFPYCHLPRRPVPKSGPETRSSLFSCGSFGVTRSL